MKSMATLTKPIPVRLLESDNQEIRAISKETGVAFASLVRLAVSLGLPGIKKQFNQPKTKKEVA